MLPEDKQMQLVRIFYFDHLPRSNAFSVDSSIGSAIRNSAGLSMKKVIENGDDRTELSVSTVNNSEEKKKSVSLWKNFGCFSSESCNFSIEKANLLANTIFYVNQGYQSFKDNKKVYYQDGFIVAQIMPLAHQPTDIESYELKEDEVKILRSRYDPVSGEFLGIEYYVALITVRNDPEEQFFDYGYIKENSKVIFSTKKKKIPRCLKSTVFGQHKSQYEAGVFDQQEHSQIFFYLDSTVDRNENISKYLTSVFLRPFSVDPKKTCL